AKFYNEPARLTCLVSSTSLRRLETSSLPSRHALWFVLRGRRIAIESSLATEPAGDERSVSVAGGRATAPPKTPTARSAARASTRCVSQLLGRRRVFMCDECVDLCTDLAPVDAGYLLLH